MVRGSAGRDSAEEAEWREDVAALLKSRKAAQRELAVQVMRAWNDPEVRQMLTEALAVEKSGKLAALLKDILQLAPEEQAGSLTPEEKVKELHKGGKKRTLAWAYETPFSAVHKKDGTEAEETYLQGILCAMPPWEPQGSARTPAWLAEQLNQEELAVYVESFSTNGWRAARRRRKSGCFMPPSIHGGSEIVEKLAHQIREWPQHARGAIATEAVKALA